MWEFSGWDIFEGGGGGNFPGGNLMGGNFLGRNFPRGNFSRTVRTCRYKCLSVL